jgi:hypothetical protein
MISLMSHQRDPRFQDIMRRLMATIEAVKLAARTMPSRPLFRDALYSPSSPANAGDPVNADVSILINVAKYWMPRLRGA